MTFLADGILLATLTSMVGFGGQALIASKGLPYDTMLLILVPALILIGAGNLRICFKKIRYTSWQIIGLKIALYADAICYFMIGVYIMYANW